MISLVLMWMRDFLYIRGGKKMIIVLKQKVSDEDLKRVVNKVENLNILQRYFIHKRVILVLVKMSI